MPVPLRPMILIALPIFGACVATLYYLHLKDKDWEGYMRSLRLTELEVKVPEDCVGTLIGRGGVTIRELQDQSNARINFKNAEAVDGYRVCRIRGTKEEIEEARTLILSLIAAHESLQTVEIWIPQKACGRIIGRCGDTIRSICKISNAQVSVDKICKNKDSPPGKKLVVIRGTEEQVALAKSLVEEKLQEEESFQMKSAVEIASRSPRGKIKPKRETVVPEFEGDKLSPKLPMLTSESMMEVYISAVENPTHFWLQLVSPKSVDLDHLVEEMTEYYSQEENRELHRLTSIPEVGQILAAKFSNDNKWYRTELVQVIRNYENPERVLDVFYVDYGDSDYKKLDEVLTLRTDFLSLRFQAIECMMKGILPFCGEKWAEESISSFEDLTFTAQWRPIMAQLVGYEPSALDTEGKPIPCVRLFNPEGVQGIDVGMQLIKMGLARSDAEECEKNQQEDIKSSPNKMNGSKSSSFEELSEPVKLPTYGGPPSPVNGVTEEKLN